MQNVKQNRQKLRDFGLSLNAGQLALAGIWGGLMCAYCLPNGTPKTFDVTPRLFETDLATPLLRTASPQLKLFTVLTEFQEAHEVFVYVNGRMLAPWLLEERWREGIKWTIRLATSEDPVE